VHESTNKIEIESCRNRQRRKFQWLVLLRNGGTTNCLDCLSIQQASRLPMHLQPPWMRLSWVEVLCYLLWTPMAIESSQVDETPLLPPSTNLHHRIFSNHRAPRWHGVLRLDLKRIGLDFLSCLTFSLKHKGARVNVSFLWLTVGKMVSHLLSTKNLRCEQRHEPPLLQTIRMRRCMGTLQCLSQMQRVSIKWAFRFTEQLPNRSTTFLPFRSFIPFDSLHYFPFISLLSNHCCCFPFISFHSFHSIPFISFSFHSIHFIAFIHQFTP